MSKTEGFNDVQYCEVPTRDKEKGKEEDIKNVPTQYGYGIRHVQLVIFFFCMAVSFIARGHLGVTLVAMTSHQNIKKANTFAKTNSSAYDSANKSSIDGINHTVINNLIEKFTKEDANFTIGSNVTIMDAANAAGYNKSEESWTIYRTYDWTKPIQEMVLTAFFPGYCVMMFPIALVCQRWGGKVPLQISMLINGIVSILTPHLALWGGWKAVCICRVLQGLSQSGTFPGIQTLLAQWVPSNERASLSGYVYTGTTIGTVIGFQLSGLIADAWGWPAVFWTVGLLCLVTCALLSFFGASSPRVHKKITVDEKNYIMGEFDSGKVKKRQAPWKAIITSKPVWANIATHVGSSVSFFYFLTQVPSYIHYILGIDVKNSGLLSSLPYLASFFTSLSFGVISDYFTNRNIVSVKNARRIFNSISQVGVATSLICASYASSTTFAILCLVVSMSCHMGMQAGWMMHKPMHSSLPLAQHTAFSFTALHAQRFILMVTEAKRVEDVEKAVLLVNEIDLSPNFSGTLMALGNILMNISMMIMPIIISNIVIDMTNLYQWRIMLYIVAAIAFIPNLIFVAFISADVQPWNDGDFIESEEINDVKLEVIMKKKTNN